MSEAFMGRDPAQTMEIVRCIFHLRTPASGGLFNYKIISADRRRNGALHTLYPPLIGDLIDLDGNLYRVLEREWNHAINAIKPTAPLITFIIEQASGLFIDESPLDQEDELS